MSLSNDLISQFVKITNDNHDTKQETTVYGTTVVYDGQTYVRIDGSDRLTPVVTTTDVKSDERVTVLIKNHTATVTGNISSPSARTEDLHNVDLKTDQLGNKISEFETIVADKVSTKELEAEKGRIDELVSNNIIVKEKLTANEADISTLEADNAVIKEKLVANEADIDSLNANKLDANVAKMTYATITNLEALDANVYNLSATYGEFADLTTNKFAAVDGSIKDLETKKLSADDAALRYANIDFTNISNAAVEKLFTDSGIIKDLVVSEGKITGELVGVTIRGDLIEGNTIVADKLVVKGEDGLYYKLNTDGVSVETEQTDYNSLNGSVIRAKSVTAEKIAVDDLVAFDATIGGFHITNSALYSGVKASIDNTTRGTYLDKDGQISIGDGSNYLKYFKDTDGKYKLIISADDLIFGSEGSCLSELETKVNLNAENIESVTTKTENVEKNITKAESNIAQNAESIKQTVTKIENIKLGGRNLILQSEHFVHTRTDTTKSWLLPYPQLKNSEYGIGLINQGGEFTLSFDYEITGITTACNLIPCLEYANLSYTKIGLTIPLVVGDNSGRAEYTFTPTATQMQWGRGWLLSGFGAGQNENAVINIEHIKLEKGNKVTDWTPAPEDQAAYVDEEIFEVTSKITQTAEEIIMGILEGYTTTTDLETYKKQIENTLKVNKDGFNFEFSQLEEQLTAVGDELIERNQYIRLQNGEIIIGKSDSAITSVYTNNALEFRNNGQMVARFTNDVLEVRNVSVENQYALWDEWALRKGKYITGKGYNLNVSWIGG